jgi:large subunit ribosomal protein L25
MEKVLHFTIREEFKKGPSKRLRREGKIPSIVYGHSAPLPIAIEEKEFRNKFKAISESTIIKLKSNDKSLDVLVKDFDEDYISGKIVHIDFYEIEKGKMLKTHVPIHLEGTAEGVKAGGLLEMLTHEVEIECLPKDLPHDIKVDITDLNIGESLHVSDLSLSESIRIITPKEQVICTIAGKHMEEVPAEEIEGEEEAEAEAEESPEVAKE